MMKLILRRKDVGRAIIGVSFACIPSLLDQTNHAQYTQTVTVCQNILRSVDCKSRSRSRPLTKAN